MKKIIATLLVLGFISSCNSKYEIERELESCFFNSFPKQGRAAEKIIRAFEKVLIDKGVLENNSSLEYYKIFKKLTKQEFLDCQIEYSLMDSLNKITPINFVDFNVACIEKLENHKDYNKSITYKIKKKLQRFIIKIRTRLVF